MREFGAALKGAEAGVLFYAGHGLQVAGQNYLVPIDAKADEPDALEFEMLRVEVIHRIMERQTNTNILFLDACRDNPLARDLARSMGTRSTEIGKGLAAVESGVGTLISFSTQPGNVALDGRGRNSPFAGALTKQLSTSNDDLSSMLIAVRNDVMKETQRKQIPWEHSALTKRFYFSPSTAKSVGTEPNSEHWIALQTASASTSFTPGDFQRVSSLARQKGILLPEFTVRQVGDEVAETNRRFVGVWVTNSHGLGGVNGRQFMVIVTNADARGYVVGHIARGPSTALSLNQIPAGHTSFSSQIANGTLAIKLGTGTMIASLDGSDRLVLLEQLKDGRQVTTILDRVWSLGAR